MEFDSVQIVAPPNRSACTKSAWGVYRKERDKRPEPQLARSATASKALGEGCGGTGSSFDTSSAKREIPNPQSDLPRSQQSKTLHCRRTMNLTRPATHHYYSFSLINKELNNMARDKPDRQSILIKNFIRIVFDKATITKGDFISMERWIHRLRSCELQSLCDMVAALNSAMRLLLEIIDLDFAKFRSSTENSAAEHPRRQPEKNRQMLSRELQERTATFKHFYLNVMHVANRHLYTTVPFPELTKKVFERLLESSMKVRYLLGLVHKEIEQLEQAENKAVGNKSPQSPSQQRSNRILQMSRAMKRKYNMENCDQLNVKHESLHVSRLCRGATDNFILG